VAGDFETAGAIARKVLAGAMVREPVPSERLVMSALAAAGEGAHDRAKRELEAAANVPQIHNRYYVAVILGQYLRTRGDCAGAIVAYERAQALPWHPMAGEKPFVTPLVLHSLALCLEKMGDLEKARARNEEMLRLWERADPDLPLLAEARALKARLAAATR
jgi:tetratricopeptide (TPR) repeat protein